MIGLWMLLSPCVQSAERSRQLTLSDSTGAVLFNQTCVACHTIGKGRLVGPDLIEVTKNRDTLWLIDFIRSSQTLIKKGDKQAIAQFEAFNKIVMPDNSLSDKEIKSILRYITIASDTSNLSLKKPIELKVPDEEPDGPLFEINSYVKQGRGLFQGLQKLTLGGPACISCHHADIDPAMGGGETAQRIETAFGRLGSQGIRTMLKWPSHPLMKQVYKDQKLKDNEIKTITAYLEWTNGNYAKREPKRWSSILT